MRLIHYISVRSIGRGRPGMGAAYRAYMSPRAVAYGPPALWLSLKGCSCCRPEYNKAHDQPQVRPRRGLRHQQRAGADRRRGQRQTRSPRRSSTTPAARPASSSIRRTPTSPGRTRPTRSTGIEAAVPAAVAAAKKQVKGFRPEQRRRHRRRHDRLDAAAGRRPGHAAGRRQASSRRTSPPWPGCGRITPAIAEAAEITEAAGRAAPRVPGQVRRHLQQRVVLVARSCTACASAPKVFEAAYAWVELADFDPGRAHRQRRSRRA